MGQRLDGLERGDGGQRQQGQEDAVDLAGGHQRDGQEQHGQRGQAGAERGQTVAQAAHLGQPLLSLVELLAESQRAGLVGLFLATGQQIGDALNVVHQRGVQLGAQGDGLGRRLAAEPAAGQRQGDAGEQQET